MPDIRLSGISMEQIKLFLAVVESNSFTAAGSSMFLTQSTVSRKISALEQDLGFALFLREKGKVRPTAAGKLLYQRLKDIFAQFEAAVTAAALESGEEMRTLTIGVLDPLAVDDLMPTIARFRKRYPMTVVRLETHEFAELRRGLADGALDLIFTMSFELPAFSALYAHRMLSEEPAQVFMSAQHPLARSRSLTMADLKNERFVVHAQSLVPSYHQYLEELCAESGFRPAIAREVSNHNALFPALLQNDGVLIAGATFGRSGMPGIVGFPLEGTVSGMAMIWRKSNEGEELRTLIDLAARE